MTKQIIFAGEGKRKVLAGIQKLANSVRVTLGPRGRNAVIYNNYGQPLITNDGVTIAKEISLSDPFENIGAQIIKEAASKTNDNAGDGTTTATILAHAIIREGMTHLKGGYFKKSVSPILLRAGIEKAVKAIVVELKKMSKSISTNEEIAQIGALSSASEEVGNMIAEIMDQIGNDGTITIQEGSAIGLQKEVVDGVRLDNGFMSPYMVTDPARAEAVADNADILVVDESVSNIDQILPLLEKLAAAGKKELVIVAQDFSEQAISTIVLNRIKGVFSILAIKAPGFGSHRTEVLNDIIALTGGKLVSKTTGVMLDDIEALGKADKVIATKEYSTIIGGKGDITDRIALMKKQLESAQDDYEKDQIKDRITKLSGGVGIIHIGAVTEIEMKEQKMRIDDAINATKAAVKEGILPGGGEALLRASAVLDGLCEGEEQIGVDIVKKALSAPILQIANNAGKNGASIMDKVLSGKQGYNAHTDKFEDMIKAGVIDPTKVVRSGLENAASVAASLLTAETFIVEEKCLTK